MLKAWHRARRRRARRRAASACLDGLFARPEVLGQGRLGPQHRHRLVVLEIETDAGGQVERLLLGIVRHPRSHPLAPRGDEVLELLEYRPAAGTLVNVGSRNLTRRGTGPPDAGNGG